MPALYRLAGVRVVGPWFRRRYPAEVPEDVAALLVRAAEGFIRAFGGVTLREWRRLSPPERAAFVVAGDMVRADMAACTGFASQGTVHALAIQGVVDGGAALDRVGLEAEAQRIAKACGAAEVRRP